MARYQSPSARDIAAFDRAVDAALAAGSARSNPAGKTITARRHGTCPITGDHISPGDSITKTDEGWALTEHVGEAMENPRQFQKGKGKFVKTPKSVREHNRYYDMFEQTYFEGGPGEHAEFLAHSKKPVAKFQQVENPSKGGAAMRYAKAHGVSLKEGWAAVKAGRANPRTFPGGMSSTQRTVSSERKRSRAEDRAEGRSLADVMFTARPGSRAARRSEQELREANRRKRRAFEQETALENPSAGARAMRYAQDHGVSLKEGWRAVKTGRA